MEMVFAAFRSCLRVLFYVSRGEGADFWCVMDCVLFGLRGVSVF